MTAEGHKVASLHGAKDAAERDAIIDNFREGKEKVLITTNVIARGIDILQVNMVVNYDLPLMNERDHFGNKEDARPDIETYIHRIGACPSRCCYPSTSTLAPTAAFYARLRARLLGCLYLLGERLTLTRRDLAWIWFRSHGAIRSQGYLDQLCARQGDMAADGADREGDWQADHPYRDKRPRRDGGGTSHTPPCVYSLGGLFARVSSEVLMSSRHHCSK